MAIMKFLVFKAQPHPPAHPGARAVFLSNTSPQTYSHFQSGIALVIGGIGMARERLGGLKFTMRFPEGVAERIDAVRGSGRRAEFIREAVEAALLRVEGAQKEPAPVVVPKAPEKVIARSLPEFKPDGDADVIRAVLGRGVKTERQLSQDLDWPVMRVSRVLERMGDLEWVRGGVRLPLGDLTGASLPQRSKASGV